MMRGRLTLKRLTSAIALGLAFGSIVLTVDAGFQYAALGHDAFIARHDDGFSLVGWMRRNQGLIAAGAAVLGAALLLGFFAVHHRRADARGESVAPDPDRAPASLIRLQLLAPHLSARQSLVAELLRLAVRGGARLTADRQGRLLLEPTGRTAGLDPELERLAHAVFGRRGEAVALDDPSVREALERLRRREARALARARLLRRDPHELRGVMLRLALAYAVVCITQLILGESIPIEAPLGFFVPLMITLPVIVVLGAGIVFVTAADESRYTTTRRGAAAARAVLDSVVELRDGERLARLAARRLAELLPTAVALESPEAVCAFLLARQRAGDPAADWLGGELRDDLGGLVRAMRIALGSSEGEWRRRTAPEPVTFHGRPVDPAEYAAFRTALMHRSQHFGAWRESRADVRDR